MNNAPQPALKVEQSVVTKLLITGAAGLDPITVFLEDHEPGRGNLTIRCHQESWGSGWGAMGQDRKVAEFVRSCGADYLIGSLRPQLRSTRFSSDELVKMAQRCVLDRRRDRNRSEWNWMDQLDKREARSLYNQVQDLHGCSEAECWQHNGLLTKLFGAEWWYKADEATERNPDWDYLERILDAVQDGLKQAQGVAA